MLWAAGLLLCAAAGFSLWLLSHSSQDSRGAGAIAKLRLGISASEAATLAYVAIEQGFLEEAGLDAEIKSYEAGKLAADALVSGDVDVITSADFVLVSKSFDQPDLRVLGTIAIAKSMKLVGRRDRGIAQAEDLVRKRVGVTRGSSAEFLFGRFLSLNGLQLEDVEIVDLPPSGLVEGVTQGGLDAAFSWDPNIYKIAKSLGENAVIMGERSAHPYYFLLLAKSGWLDRNPSVGERLLRALKRAERYARDNPGAVQALIRTKFGYDESYSRQAMKQQTLTVELPQSLLTTMEDQARWILRNGFTTSGTKPNYLNFLHFEAIEAVSPEAVTVIR